MICDRAPFQFRNTAPPDRTGPGLSALPAPVTQGSRNPGAEPFMTAADQDIRSREEESSKFRADDILGKRSEILVGRLRFCGGAWKFSAPITSFCNPKLVREVTGEEARADNSFTNLLGTKYCVFTSSNLNGSFLFPEH